MSGSTARPSRKEVNAALVYADQGQHPTALVLAAEVRALRAELVMERQSADAWKRVADARRLTASGATAGEDVHALVDAAAIADLAQSWVRAAVGPLNAMRAMRSHNPGDLRAAEAKLRAATSYAIELGELLDVEIVSGDTSETDS